MLITNVTVEESKHGTKLSGKVAEHELYYHFPPGIRVEQRGDAFLAAALLLAMQQGTPLVIDRKAPVSPLLLAGARTLQDIFAMWYPFLKVVPIEAVEAPAKVLNAGVASFFSGGVDGSYTYLKNCNAITHLLFVKGIDMQLSNDALFQEAREANQGFVESEGKVLLPLETNVRFLGRRFPPLNWSICHGGGLASIGLALGFERVFIAASHTYSELFPWGSHPLTDGYWSSEATTFVHDGAEASRTVKLSRVASKPEALNILRVCWQDAGYNCGQCEKCLRTMVALRSLGVAAPKFPPLDPRAVSRLRIADQNELSFFLDNLRCAKENGDVELTRRLRQCVRRFQCRVALRNVDSYLLGGLVQRLRERKRQ